MIVTTPLILGLDPAYGLRKHPGVAALHYGALVAADAVVIPPCEIQNLELGARVDRIANRVTAWFDHIIRRYDLNGGDITLVWEWPQIYGVGKSKVDPNDLPQLAALGQAVARDIQPGTIITPKPREWQGGTSKNTEGNPWDCTRGRKLITRLTPEERALVPDSHDAIDAVCLALHPTPRALAIPRRVFPGAT